MLPLSVIILSAVLLLTALRQLVRVRIPIWLIMLGGALAALVTGQIPPLDAVRAVNLDVILFLFGMFVVGRALEESGLLLTSAYGVFGRARRTGALVAMVLLGSGALSAVLVNDTIAVIGTPLVLYHARRHGISPTLLLLALAFGVTTGSVMSPIGNPQNLLVALGGSMANPFGAFFLRLALPTVISLGLAWVALRLAFPREFHDGPLVHEVEPLKDRALARLSMASVTVIGAAIIAKIVVVAAGLPVDIRLTWIALAGAAPLLLGSRRRLELLRGIDWTTLVFFAAMFVLMAAVWRSGFLQRYLDLQDAVSVPRLLGLSIVGSQVVSNVPFVALVLPVLGAAAAPALLLALAAGSTIAGNALVLGAASNVIIIQAAESSGPTISFLDFAKVGIPLTVAQAAVYAGTLLLIR